MVDQDWDIDRKGDPVATEQQNESDEEVEAVLGKNQLEIKN